MQEIFYRWHRADAPPFNADNAWSGLWGAEFSPDGSRTKCGTCNGSGDGTRACPRCKGRLEDDCSRCDSTGSVPECEDCDGEGWDDCVRGYSCCGTAAELASYFAERGDDFAPGDGKVIVFEGRKSGTGFDSEPCAIPNKVIKELTWERFLATL